MTKEMVCIVCPVGCHLMIEDDDKIIGNRCPRGLEYAKIELTNPKRMVTSTVKTTHTLIPRLPVKTNKPISKKLIFECIKALDDVTIEKDIHVGDVIISSVCGSDVDVIATRNIIFQETNL